MQYRLNDAKRQILENNKTLKQNKIQEIRNAISSKLNDVHKSLNKKIKNEKNVSTSKGILFPTIFFIQKIRTY